MKKFVMIATLVASFLVIVGCSTCNSPCAKEQPCPAQHDLKGEVNDK